MGASRPTVKEGPLEEALLANINRSTPDVNADAMPFAEVLLYD